MVSVASTQNRAYTENRQQNFGKDYSTA